MPTGCRSTNCCSATGAAGQAQVSNDSEPNKQNAERARLSCEAKATLGQRGPMPVSPPLCALAAIESNAQPQLDRAILRLRGIALWNEVARYPPRRHERATKDFLRPSAHNAHKSCARRDDHASAHRHSSQPSPVRLPCQLASGPGSSNGPLRLRRWWHLLVPLGAATPRGLTLIQVELN